MSLTSDEGESGLPVRPFDMAGKMRFADMTCSAVLAGEYACQTFCRRDARELDPGRNVDLCGVWPLVL